MSIERASLFASSWGSEFIDVGDAGHINAESGFGVWEFGLNRVTVFLEKLIQD